MHYKSLKVLQSRKLIPSMELSKSLKSLSIATVACASFSSTGITQAAEEYENGVYVNIGIGAGTFSDVVWSDNSTDTFEYGFSWESGIGYDFGKTFRTELTYSNLLSEHEETGNNATFSSLIFNGFIDLPIEGSNITPFVGIGFGTTNVDAKDICTSGTSTDCADDVATISVSGGLAYAINDSTELTAKATYLGFDDISMNNNGTAFTVLESETFSIDMGARFRF
tara:strand:- start:1475 stop:2149 length:675 start_codon:yes stop_codon:yes gene_type:complete